MYMARPRVNGLLAGLPCTEAAAALGQLGRVGIGGVRRIEVIFKISATKR